MAERSSGPVKPPVIDLTARSTARAEGERPEAGPAPSPGNDNPPRDDMRGERPVLLLLGVTALGGALLGVVLTYLAANWLPLPVRERPLPPDLSADVAAQTQRIDGLATDLAGLGTRADKTEASLAATISRVDTGLGEANAAIAGLRTALATPAPVVDLTPLETELTTLKARIDALGAGASTGDATAIATSLATLQTGLDALSTRLNGVDSTISALRTDVDTARRALTDHVNAAMPSEVGPALKLPLILSGLASAFEAGKPYAAELATLEVVAPDLPIPDAVKTAAATGLMRADALTLRFEAVLPEMLSARDTTSGDWASNAVDWAKSLLALRPAEEQEGDTPDAIVSRLEGAMKRQDYAAAQALLAQLPAPMKAAAAPVVPLIAARAAADELLVNLRGRALAAAEASQ